MEAEGGIALVRIRRSAFGNPSTVPYTALQAVALRDIHLTYPV